jgi:hypothetical protein
MREFLLGTLSSLSDTLASAQWRTTGDAKRDALVRLEFNAVARRSEDV